MVRHQHVHDHGGSDGTRVLVRRATQPQEPGRDEAVPEWMPPPGPAARGLAGVPPHAAPMRDEPGQLTLFTLPIEERIPRRHPLRAVRTATAAVLHDLAPRLAPFASAARQCLPADQVLRAILLWGLYSIPSERRLIEEIDYNLLHRWFVGLTPEAHMWSRGAFRRRRITLTRAGCVAAFVGRTLARLRGGVLAHPHLTVNRPLLDAWAGQERIPELDP